MLKRKALMESTTARNQQQSTEILHLSSQRLLLYAVTIYLPRREEGREDFYKTI